METLDGPISNYVIERFDCIYFFQKSSILRSITKKFKLLVIKLVLFHTRGNKISRFNVFGI